MRNDFVRQLLVEMAARPNLFMLTGDLGFKALEPLQEQFPDRFINVGVAEANMASVAAGLALAGKQVVIYSIASFAAMRCFEQIRNDICYHNLNVKIVGVGGGFNYGYLGVTHHTVEDLAIMRALPNMKILCPAYGWEATEATKAMLNDSGPVYLRLGKSPGKDFYRADFTFSMGKGFVIKDGNDIVLACTSNTLETALAAAETVEKTSGQSVCVMSLPSVKPLDEELLVRTAKTCHAFFTIEEHTINGGFGSAILETLNRKRALPPLVHIFGIPDIFVKDVGDHDYLCQRVGLDSAGVSQTILAMVSSVR